MRGAVQIGIEQIEVRDVPEPLSGEGIAVVRVRAAGICGSDLHPYHGRATPQVLPDGHEVAGEVVALPDDYRGPLRPGDLVAVDTICYGVACGACDACAEGFPFHCPARWTTPNWGGGFAERIRRRTAGLFRLPPGLTAEQGALVEPFTIGVHAMRYAKVPPGVSVAVVGAGTIGLMMLLAARAMGAGPVHVLARHPHQAALAEALGATTVIRSDQPDAVDRVRAVTDGRGADVVVETVGGHADTFGLSCDLARRRGMVVVLGIFPNRVSTDLLKPVDRELWAIFPCCYGTIDGRADFDVAIDLIASGQAPVERLVTHRFPLEAAPEAFHTAADKSTGSVKVHVVM
jgi:threonine dehydrogenase-like Zn-dependent dehydrogenase